MVKVLAVAAALAVCAAGQAPPRRTIQLASKTPADTFSLPGSVWTDINSFVFLVAFDLKSPGAINTAYPSRFSQLNSYPQLFSAGQTWGAQTFPALQQLASLLAKGDIRKQMADLGAALAERTTNARRAKTDFDRAFARVNSTLTSLVPLTNKVSQQAQQLESAARVAIAEYDTHHYPENPWINVGPHLSDVSKSIGLLQGQWGALTSDLKDLQQLMSNNRLDDVDVDIGLATWDDIARTAAGFVAGIPTDQKYLSGDNYYDNCPLNTDALYQLQNFFLMDRNFVLAATSTGLVMAGSPSNATQWQFRKVSHGWWSISNGASGSGKLLDVENNGSDFPPVMAAAGPFSGQLWRCMSTEKPGWFRLVNAFNGELRSLDTYSNTFAAYMAKTDNLSGQYWRLGPVR